MQLGRYGWASASRTAVATAALAMVCGGCSTEIEPSYTDPTPAARLGAMGESASHSRMEDVPQLVANLAADDPAVRMAAIEALRQITGTTLDYRASASRNDRNAAIERWKAWMVERGLAPASMPRPASPKPQTDSGTG